MKSKKRTYFPFSQTADKEQHQLEIKSKETLTHVACLKSGICQETEGFKGTKYEGVDVCEDGCVWYQTFKKV